MMETGFELLLGGFMKDEEAVTLTISVDEFIGLRYTIKNEYHRAKQNESIHGLPVPQILEELYDKIESKFFSLSKEEEVRCDG